MSLDTFRTGEKPSRCLTGEGRREEAGQQSEPSQRSGGVGVDGTSGSSIKVSWENSGVGCKTQPPAQAGRTSEAGGVVGEVGVPRSSNEAPVTGVERRWDTCSEVRCDRWPMAPRGDTPPRGPSSSTLMEGACGNAQTRPDSESRIWENRPFGSMRGGRESVIGLVPFNPTSPAYSTSRVSPDFLLSGFGKENGARGAPAGVSIPACLWAVGVPHKGYNRGCLGSSVGQSS